MTIMRVFWSVCLIFWIGIGFWFVLEPPYLSYPSLPFAVISHKVKAGEAVQVIAVRCNSDRKTRVYLLSHILVRIDDKQTIVLPSTSASLQPGCTTAVSVVNVVPLYTPPGLYFLRGTAEVSSTLRNFSVPWESEPFEVVE